MKNFLSFLFVIIFLWSCTKDVTLNIPKEPSKIAIHSVTSVGEAFTAQVGKTQPITESNNPDIYKLLNARVLIYEEGVLKDSLHYVDSVRQYISSNPIIAKSQKKYDFVVTTPEFAESATATAVMPQKVPILSTIINRNVIIKNEYDTLSEIVITFQDPPTTNYYIINLQNPQWYNILSQKIEYDKIYCLYPKETDIDNVQIFTDVNSEDCIGPDIFLSDKQFNSQIKVFKLLINNYELRSVTLANNTHTYFPIITLSNVTEDYYRYRVSKEKYDDTDENPFAEPVFIYNNIKKGYGIFGLQNIAVDTLHF